jgi:hypothetical protein
MNVCPLCSKVIFANAPYTGRAIPASTNPHSSVGVVHVRCRDRVVEDAIFGVGTPSVSPCPCGATTTWKQWMGIGRCRLACSNCGSVLWRQITATRTEKGGAK